MRMFKPSIKRHILNFVLVMGVTGCGTARHLDNSPSGTSLENATVLTERNFESFMASWLNNKAKEVDPAPGATRTYHLTVAPPTRPGYHRVGGREINDGFSVFRQWCKNMEGDFQEGVSYKRLIPAPVSKIESVPGNSSDLVCLQRGRGLGAIRLSIDRSVKDESVNMFISAYAEPSLAALHEKEARIADDERAAKEVLWRNEQARQTRENEAYRASIKIGSIVSCGTVGRKRLNGMVIEMRPPIALVQFPNLVPDPKLWVKIDELDMPR